MFTGKNTSRILHISRTKLKIQEKARSEMCWPPSDADSGCYIKTFNMLKMAS